LTKLQLSPNPDNLLSSYTWMIISIFSLNSNCRNLL